VDRTTFRDGGEEKNPYACWDLNPTHLNHKAHMSVLTNSCSFIEIATFYVAIFLYVLKTPISLRDKPFDVMI
jgi:hypothetical protein